jgi:hypothetical protein
MVGFFSGLILVGISLIIISIILVMYDRKRDVEEKEEFVSLKRELRSLLEDSNDMVDELNKFSDYIVTTVDEKCTEFRNLMKDAPDKNATFKEPEVKSEAIQAPAIFERSTDENIIILDDNSFSEDIEPTPAVSEAKNNGVNPKHSEVMRLFESGMSDIEIARTLNMGKGEVQLIVGLNIHKIKV